MLLIVLLELKVDYLIISIKFRKGNVFFMNIRDTKGKMKLYPIDDDCKISIAIEIPKKLI